MKIVTVADNIVSPLGSTTQQNFDQACAGHRGIALIQNDRLYKEAFYGARVNEDQLSADNEQYTKLERMFIQSIADALSQTDGLEKHRTQLVLATTKGNIDLFDPLEASHYPADRMNISVMAQAINNYFQLPKPPVVISNACSSGVSALLIAKKLITMGQCDHAIVTGGDLLTEFTISGFQALMTIDSQPCRPYDKARGGITLGEGCATLIITREASLGIPGSEIIGGGQSNDANHISGPSRTGEGLTLAVEKALSQCGVKPAEVDYIAAHGTATRFNDEMESIAFGRVGLQAVPLNSLKGYFGHTLGGAGVMESVLAIKQMNSSTLIKSIGYDEHGVSGELNVITELRPKNIDTVLKTVSGFGGNNAAIVFRKI